MSARLSSSSVNNTSGFSPRSEMKVLLSVSDLNVSVCFMRATVQPTMSSSNVPDSIARYHADLFQHHLHCP